MSADDITIVSDESRKVVEKEKPAHLLIPLSHLPGQTITTLMNEVLDPIADDSESSGSDTEDRVVQHEALDPLENMPPQ